MLHRNIIYAAMQQEESFMPSLQVSLAQLKHLRRKFDCLLAAARAKSSGRRRGASARRMTRLRELTAFGANPGNLRMFVYVPARLPSMPGLVVALHGCTQTADDYDHGTGWSTLADQLGFIVVYPEQQPSNNAKNCFSWFLPGDIQRDRGEALSIREMVGHALVSFGIDRRKVFVTGVSAGGAMASVMLATYPEVFAGGAIVAGLPYGCAASVQEAFEAMFMERSASERELGDSVRAASWHQGPWPRISVWHGTADPIVRASNADNIIRQWRNVHALQAHPAHEEKFARHTRRIWSDASGKALIEAISINGMAHGVPIASAMGGEGCGAAGPFFLDVGISSTHQIANFWGMGGDCVGTVAEAAVSSPEPTLLGAATRNTELSAIARHSAIASNEPAMEWDEMYGARGPVDPNRVIAAAFKAAGLPIPEVPSLQLGARPSVVPGPIIEAALKAAGLVRR